MQREDGQIVYFVKVWIGPAGSVYEKQYFIILRIEPDASGAYQFKSLLPASPVRAFWSFEDKWEKFE